MATENCPDCRSVSDSIMFPSDGKCKECDGSGYVGFYDGAVKAIGGQDQSCEVCHGSGKCQTCDGKGYID